MAPFLDISMRTTLAIFAVVVGCSSTFAADAVKLGEPYAAARARVLTMGWKPGDFSRSAEPGRCSGSIEICEKYHEVEDCAGSGDAPCALMFTKPGGGRVRIVTVGEEISDMVVDNVQDPPLGGDDDAQ